MSDDYVWRGAGGRLVRFDKGGAYGVPDGFKACRGDDEWKTFWHTRGPFRGDREFKTQREALFAALEYATSESETSHLRKLASAYMEIA